MIEYRVVDKTTGTIASTWPTAQLAEEDIAERPESTAWRFVVRAS